MKFNNKTFQMDVEEKDVEKRLFTKVKKIGGKAYKFVSPMNRGVPDRFITMPHEKCYFVECKKPGKKPDPLQVIAIAELRAKGFKVFVIDNFDKVDKFISLILDDQKQFSAE